MNAHIPPLARCYDTGKVRIGACHIAQPSRVISRDAERLQAAMLDPKTASEPSIFQRLLSAIWRWL